MKKYKFRHRNIYNYNIKCFNRLLNRLVKKGFKIECCGLIDCKPMMTETEAKNMLSFIDKAKEMIYIYI